MAIRKQMYTYLNIPQKLKSIVNLCQKTALSWALLRKSSLLGALLSAVAGSRRGSEEGTSQHRASFSNSLSNMEVGLCSLDFGSCVG